MKVKRRANLKNIGQNFLVLALSVLIASSAQAQEVADSPCDVNYYESLKSRAWLEAQREITQNQNLIFKPDSVLEYTCFDLYLNVLAQQASSMFSESSRWGEVLPNDSMDNALESLVGTPIASYINSNFETPGYDLLGGRAGTVPDGDDPNIPPLDALSPELDHVPDAVSGGSYACDIMNRVWEQAKCMDFMQAPTEDGFFTLAHYAEADDKRFLPARCSGPGNLWQDNIDMYADPETYEWERDNALTYLESFLNASCEDSEPVLTGVQVKRLASPSNYAEKICLSPGCYYDPAEDSCRDSSNLY